MSKTKLEYDIVLVGGSPSNLTLAHRLLDLAKDKGSKLSIAIIEKSENFGGHIVSGAVVSKAIFDKAYPKHFEEGMPVEAVCDKSYFSIMSPSKKWDLPSAVTRAAAPDFCKEGYYILTLSLVVQWMATSLLEKAKQVPNVILDVFPGFPAVNALYNEAADRVIGVSVARTGDPLDDNIYAKLVCFADKGFVSKDIINKFKLAGNPQLWSVGVKETWRLPENLEHIEKLLGQKSINGKNPLEGKVWHTLGYPTLDGTLGGGFIYGLAHRRVTIGLVISLDSKNPNIHPQKQLQEYKKHPFVQELIKGGELLHYGAAVLPEGGYEALPKAFQVNGALLLGDALGLLDMKSLAGVDKAIESGYLAASVALDAIESGDTSAAKLSKYQDKLLESPFMEKLKANKYFRQAFAENPDLLENYIPEFVDSIERHAPSITSRSAMGSNLGGLVAAGMASLKIGLKNPIKAIRAALRADLLLNRSKDIETEVKYHAGYTQIDPNFSKELIAANAAAPDANYSKATIYSREDAVFYAQTKYNYHPDHIDEFSADTCLRCIKTYEAKGLDVPCVSDCTAEVHRLDLSDAGAKSHAMSLENCVQCRTCELICPEQNLRVNAAYAGSGPDFRGL